MSVRYVAILALIGVVLASLYGGPAAALPLNQPPGFREISGDPLRIQVAPDARVQVYHERYDHGAVYGDACSGPFLALGSDVYGPYLMPGPSSTPMEPVHHEGPVGNGASSDPFRIVTAQRLSGSGAELRVEQTVSYVDGSNYFRLDWQITNEGSGRTCFKFYHGADLYFADDDQGIGYYSEETGAVGGYNQEEDWFMAFFPLTPAIHYEESGFNTIWERISNGADLNDTTDIDYLDNGAALQWDICLQPGESTTVSDLWSFGTSETEVVPPEVAPPANPPGEEGELTPPPDSESDLEHDVRLDVVRESDGQVRLVIEGGSAAAGESYLVLMDTESEGGMFAGEELEVGPHARTIYEGELDGDGRAEITLDLSDQQEMGYEYVYQVIVFSDPLRLSPGVQGEESGGGGGLGGALGWLVGTGALIGLGVGALLGLGGLVYVFRGSILRGLRRLMGAGGRVPTEGPGLVPMSKKEAEELKLDVVLRLRWEDSARPERRKAQWIQWIGEEIKEGPFPEAPIFPASDMILEFEAINRAADGRNDALDLDSIRLIADFPCNEVPMGENLYRKPFTRFVSNDTDLVKGWFQVEDPLESGQYRFSLSARDTKGHSKSILLSFRVDGVAPVLQLYLQGRMRGGQYQHREWKKGVLREGPEERPIFSTAGLKLNFLVKEERDQEVYSGLDPESVRLTADFPCLGAGKEANLVKIEGVREVSRDEDLYQGWVKGIEVEGRHTFTLSACDKAGNTSQVTLAFTAAEMVFVDADNDPLASIHLVWREWADYEPFYFYVVIPYHSTDEQELEGELVIEAPGDDEAPGERVAVTFVREEETNRFRAGPFLACGDKPPDGCGAVGMPVKAVPGGKIRAKVGGLERALDAPDRRAIILAPALGCPGLVHEGGELDVVLLMRHEQWPDNGLPGKADVAGALGWCSWKDRDKGKIKHFRPDDVTAITNWSGGGIGVTRHIASTIPSLYSKRDYKKYVVATLCFPREAGPGMYALLALHDAGGVLRESILRPQSIPQSAEKNWVCPALDNTMAMGFQPHEKAERVSAYHPVAVFEKDKQVLNIAHLSDLHVAARAELLQRRWDDKTQAWRPFEDEELTVDAQDLWRRSVAFRSPYYPHRVWYCGSDKCPGHSSPEHNCRSDTGVHVWKCSNPDCIGHISYEHRCTSGDNAASVKPGEFGNPNAQVRKMLEAINDADDIDVVIITGDLIDYNRGLKWYERMASKRNHLRKDYYFNLNWMCFYELLLDTYQKPVFTLLGNHDWHLSPYAPRDHFFSEFNVTCDEMQVLHGDHGALQEGTIFVSRLGANLPYEPLYASYEAVEWYFLVINPFSDYTVRFGRMAFVMLDWVNGAEDYRIDAPDAGDHKHFQLGKIELPWAQETISGQQWQLLQNWRNDLQKWNDANEQDTIPIVCLHAPIFNPFPEMGDEQVDSTPKWRARIHPIKENNKVYHSWYYEREHHVVHGTVMQHRTDFINWAIKLRGLVLSGHTHRGGVYEVPKNTNEVRVHQPSDFHGKSPLDQALFTVVGSSGVIGFRNKYGGRKYRRLVPPVYRHITFDKKGNLTCLDEKPVGLVPIRREVRCSYGEKPPKAELLRQGVFEVWSWYNEDEYAWGIKVSSDGQKVFAVRVKTDIPYVDFEEHDPVPPEGWRYEIREQKVDETIVLVFWTDSEAHAIWPVGEKDHPTWQRFKLEIGSTLFTKYGEISVSVDSNKPFKWSNPAMVPVPGIR